MLVLTYTVLPGQTTVYISDLFHPYGISRSLRSSDQAYCLKTKGDRTFKAVAPTLWNSQFYSYEALCY